MSTLCTCGHAKSQHHVREEGGRKLCDYAGYACACTGYSNSLSQRRVPEKKPEPRPADELPERDFYEGDSPDY